MREPGCPSCGSDLKGPPIPDIYFVHYMEDDPGWDRSRHTSHEQQLINQEERNARYKREGKDFMITSVRCFCLPYGDREPEDRFFSRKVGVDGGYYGIYDGIIIWFCPDCGHYWNRFQCEDLPSRHYKIQRLIEQFVREREAGTPVGIK